jgi:hypothetical protein
MTIFQNEEKTKKLFLISKKVLFALTILGFLFLINQNYAPAGKMTLVSDLKQKVPFLETTGFEGAEKVLADKVYYKRMAFTPATLTLNLPRLFKKVTIELKYQTPQSAILVSAQKKESKNYLSEILDVPVPQDWERIDDDGKTITLFQKSKRNEDLSTSLEEDETTSQQGSKQKPAKVYENISQFLSDLENLIKENRKIAYLKYDPGFKIKIPGYQKSNKISTFDKPLRGSHTIETYLGENEDLDFKFYYKDVDRKKGVDNIEIIVSQNEEIFHKKIPDKNAKNLQEFHLFLPKQKEGRYEISWQTTKDIFIEKIEMGQKYFAFKDQVFLANANQQVSLFTNANNLNFSTVHKEGLQTIKTEKLPEEIKKEEEDEEQEEQKEESKETPKKNKSN